MWLSVSGLSSDQLHSLPPATQEKMLLDHGYAAPAPALSAQPDQPTAAQDQEEPLVEYLFSLVSHSHNRNFFVFG